MVIDDGYLRLVFIKTNYIQSTLFNLIPKIKFWNLPWEPKPKQRRKCVALRGGGVA